MNRERRVNSVAIGTYEIEVNGYDYLEKVKSNIKFDYVDTSICYNNDYYISKCDFLKGKKLISKIPPQMTDNYEFYVSNHMKSLGVDHIDIMLIHNPRADWTELALRMNEDSRFKEVGVSNFSVDDIEKYKSITGSYPKYNEMEVNIDYYDKDLIDFCHNNGIKIISYAILGGKYNARKNISKYTLEAILTFVSGIADIVIIRSDVVRRLKRMSDRIYFLIDKCKEINIEYPEESRFNKSIEPMNYNIPGRQSILKLGTSKRILLPTYDNDLSVGYECEIISKSKINEEDFNSGNNKRDDKDDTILDMINSISAPKDLEFITDYRAFYRYKLMNILKSLYLQNKNITIEIVPEPDVLVIQIWEKKKLSFNRKKIKTIWFSVSLYDNVEKKLSKINNKNTELKLNYIG